MGQQFKPDPSNGIWLQQIKNSFKSRILTPLTSYIVVENEAQKAMLRKKQKEVLSGNKSLDAGEVQEMSEPGLFLMTVLFLLFLGVRKIRI